MGRLAGNLTRELCARFVLPLVAAFIVGGAPAGAQARGDLPPVGEGCLLYRSPISGRYESVTLVRTDVQIDVRGLLASASVTQQYANDTTEPIEAVYVFPLPHDAAVYDMEIRIADRIIRSVIRERAEAKRVYEAAKSTGKRAALVEQERPNMFTTSVANVMPGDRIDVRLRYVETLRWDEGRVRLVFPMVVGPRYIPGTDAIGRTGEGWSADTDAVPDASRITPPVRHPKSRPGHDIALMVDVDAGFDTAAIRSVSHAIDVRRLAEGRQRVELAARSTIPNKDFILEVCAAESTHPRTALFLSPGADSGEMHFLLATFPPTVAPRERIPVEMQYMIDISGSMAGTSIEQAREALLQALDRLGPEDRFSILTFSSGFSEFSPAPLPANENNLAGARRYVRRLDANGGTEMLPALVHLMRKRPTPGYVRNIILLTDGDLGNEEQIFTGLRQDLGDARLFTIAIGSAPNHFLATKMAQLGRGTFTHIADVDEVRDEMGRLFAALEHPVLTDVNLFLEGVDVADLYPQRAPDLFLNQPLLVSGHIAKGRIGTVRVTGRAADELYEATIAFDTSKATFHPGTTTLWARKRVDDLMDEWRRADAQGRADIRASVIAHAIRYGLVTRFTSLVAVEDVVVNASGRSNSVAVSTELPAGWQMDKVFGAPDTGTADAFLQALGLALLGGGVVLLVLTRRARGAA